MFRQGPTQTSLYSHRSRLEARIVGFKKKMDCTIRVKKTKALISFAVAFVFVQTFCLFSYAVAQLVTSLLTCIGVMYVQRENWIIWLFQNSVKSGLMPNISEISVLCGHKNGYMICCTDVTIRIEFQICSFYGALSGNKLRASYHLRTKR